MSKKNEMLEEYDFSKGKRGPVIPNKGKTRITIFIDWIYWNGLGMKLSVRAGDTRRP